MGSGLRNEFGVINPPIMKLDFNSLMLPLLKAGGKTPQIVIDLMVGLIGTLEDLP